MTSPNPDPPRWPHCGYGTTAEEPVGCHGRRIPGRTLGLAVLAVRNRVKR
ncbi:hypothetical protein ACFT9I_09220 [Streptomyces sp. NPDC057137]